jgi:hypothetical protein
MFKGRRKIWVIFFVLVLAGISYGLYVWNKPRPIVEDETGIEMSAIAIFDSFTNNETKATSMYVDKAIVVTGVVEEVKKNQAGTTVVILKSSDPIFGVNCTFKEDPGPIQKGSTITFKGFCKSFLSDVYITEGILLKKSS